MQAFPDRQALPVNNKMAEHCYIIIILLQILELLVAMVTATFYYHSSQTASIFSLKGNIMHVVLLWAVSIMGWQDKGKQSAASAGNDLQQQYCQATRS